MSKRYRTMSTAPMRVSKKNGSQPKTLADLPSGTQKVIGTVMSFAAVFAIFFVIRVVGVIYYGNVLEEFITFSAISAINFLVWVGFIVIILISAVVIGLIVKTDRMKLFADLSAAFIFTFGIMWFVSYNYVGFTYQYLFGDLSMTDRLFTYSTYWITVFATYYFEDIFYFWITCSAIYHAGYVFMSFVDIDNGTFMKLMIKTKKRVKSAPKQHAPIVRLAALFILFTGLCAIFMILLTHFGLSAYYNFDFLQLPILASVIFAGAFLTLFSRISEEFDKKLNGALFYIISSFMMIMAIFFYLVIENALATSILAIIITLIAEIVQEKLKSL